MTTLKWLADRFRKSVHVRFYVRSVVVAFIVYALTAWQKDSALSLRALLFAGVGGVANVVIGYLTPSEPLVGPNALKIDVQHPVVKPKKKPPKNVHTNP